MSLLTQGKLFLTRIANELAEGIRYGRLRPIESARGDKTHFAIGPSAAEAVRAMRFGEVGPAGS